MTLILNKADVTTKWIVTNGEMNTNTSGSTIEMFNPFDNKSYTYTLPADSSAYPTRYQQYTASTITYSGLGVGTYHFTIKDSSSATTETGILKVVEDVLTQEELVDNNYVYIQGESQEDDFIVYE